MSIPLTSTPVRKVFLSAICGTAMASLAGMLKEAGYEVEGSDAAVYPPMSTFLERLGITVHSGYSEDNLRRAQPDLVVIGNTLSRGNREVEYVLNKGLRYASMAATVAELFIRGKRSIVVSGTHGKTTTTAMMAWLLESAGRSPSFLVGGITENFGSSFQLGTGPEFVIEGDEYDTAFFDKRPKFSHYLPWIALLKNVEFDHADIYANLEEIKSSFRRLIDIVPAEGLIVAGTDSPVVADLVAGAHSRVATYGLETGEWRARDLESREGTTSFRVTRSGDPWHRFTIPMAGRFNVDNALGTIIAATEVGLGVVEIQVGLSGFRSVRRRLEVRGAVDGVTVYDDFAHHPTAVRETLRAVRDTHPESRVWAVFEPRSNTARRRFFENEFADALAEAAIAIVAPPFGAAKLGPDEALRPEAVVGRIRAAGGTAEAPGSVDAIIELIASRASPGDRVVVMSNGGFENIHQRLLERLARGAESAGEEPT
jgi:UDP-N-acetylmuramate: L-alanyl-gamma-D-glutamyl-meso-diaminopimelate ligase